MEVFETVVELEFMGLTLREPMTLFTDILVTIACIYFGSKILNRKWKFFYYFMGAATLVAGLAHLLYYYIGYEAHLIARTTSVIALFFAEQASLEKIRNKKGYAFLKGVSFIKLIVVITAVIIWNNFLLIKWNSSIAMIGFLFGIHLYDEFIKKSYDNHMVFWATAIGILAAIVSAKKISIHSWFTYHDIGHILMILSFYFIFRGKYKLTHT